MSTRVEIIPLGDRLIRGQDAPVQIRVFVDKPIRVRGIRANFLGVESTSADYTVTVQDSKGQSRRETRTATEQFNIVEESFVLHGAEPLGCFAGLADTFASVFGGGSGERLEPGEYSFDIILSIPSDAPASFKANKCSVSYRLNAQVDVPLKFDPSAKTEFNVDQPVERIGQGQPVHVKYPDESGRGFWDKTFGKDARLQLALENDQLRSAEPIKGLLTVETDKPINVNKIKVQLVGEERTRAQSHDDLVAHSILLEELDSPGILDVEHAQHFTFTPPDTGPFTSKGKNYSIEWWLQVQLDVPWAKDPKIRVPVKYLP